jgi:threonyl-tRNA synthetase
MHFSPLDKGEMSGRTEGVFPIELDGDQIKNLKFIDMCTGPHVENTKELDANSFKLARVA